MKWPITIGILALLAVTITGMYVTDFTAYLGDNPTTCNNCHVMDAAYEGWYHAGHARQTVCSECHTPEAFFPKYMVKARSGFQHVSAFLLGDIPPAIRARETSKEIVQANCERCHAATVATMLEASGPQDRYCFDCHRNVAHGERGISLLPYQHKEMDQ